MGGFDKPLRWKRMDDPQSLSGFLIGRGKKGVPITHVPQDASPPPVRMEVHCGGLDGGAILEARMRIADLIFAYTRGESAHAWDFPEHTMSTT